MPDVLREGEFRFYFYFYSSDCKEPRHVHVRIGKAVAKFWLDPEVRISYSKGLRQHQVTSAERSIRRHLEEIRYEWDEYCADAK